MLDKASQSLLSHIDNYINNVRGSARKPVSESALTKLSEAAKEMRKGEAPTKPSPGQMAARNGMEAVAEQVRS